MLDSGEAAAAGPRDVVFLHAVVGVPSIDVYVDGSLAVAGLAIGTASPVATLQDRADHDLVLFSSIPNPPAARTARSDAPLPTAQFFGQVRPGAIAHPEAAVVVRLGNTSNGGRWGPYEYDFPSFPDTCAPGRAAFTYDGAADLFTAAGTNYGSSGTSGTGAGSTFLARQVTMPVVVRGERFPGENGQNRKSFAFGAFDFGEVEVAVGQERFYFGFGRDGTYGAAEVVYDCATQRFLSSRTVGRNPVFPRSRFVPLVPDRLFDTREAGEPGMPTGKLAGGAQVDVPVLGRKGVPASGVTAVVLNVTATDSSAAGFVTVWPTGGTRPTTSNINLLGPGQTAPNLVTVPVGAGGRVSLYSSGGAHLLADVAGYFVEASTATAGRFVPLAPDRLFDTRQPGTVSGVVPAGGAIRVQVAGERGVPATGASAVVLNVTGVGVAGPAFLTVHPGGTAPPRASNVNLAGFGDVTSNLTIVPLGADGTVEFFASDQAHVVADVFGYMTGSSAASSSSGLFVPTSPVRVLDTRPAPWLRLPVGLLDPGEQIVVAIADEGDVPGLGASAVLANITGTGSVGAGFVTAWPAGTATPGVSTVNLVRGGTTRPNAALVPLGGLGDISLYSSGGTHALVDVFGYFTS